MLFISLGLKSRKLQKEIESSRQPEIVVEGKNPELDGVFGLVLALVRLNQQVVFLLQKLHTFVLGHRLGSLDLGHQTKSIDLVIILEYQG